MAGPLDDLRPVELLRILSEGRTQFWTRGPALEATLAGLAARGLLEPEADGGGFQPTDAADDSDVDLRPYESTVPSAIEGADDGERMVKAVYGYDFESALARRGLYREEKRASKLFGAVSWRETVRVPTDRYDAVVDELGTVREELAAAVARDQLLPAQIPLVYVFPNADFADEFGERGEARVVDGAGVDVNVDSVSASTYPTERNGDPRVLASEEAALILHSGAGPGDV